jgi:tRNA A-37 threonylcarbamoyl transferase component Bud32
MSETVVGGKYRIRGLLGEGAMGSVYEAQHVHTGRRCALKLIRSPELLADAQLVSRFEREARAAGAIASRHIAQVFDAGVDADAKLPFLVMEYLEGEDLHDLLERTGPLPTDLVLRIAAQACLGLHKAHEANVVHRDIKPHNLYLCLQDAGEVVVKLLDFGVAKIKMDQASTLAGANLTAPGSVLGTPRYMSPEQALGSATIDRRTDIWSLGAVMYQALSGRCPHSEPKTLADLILALTAKPPRPLREVAPAVAPEVADIVDRCLARQPADRFPTAQALFDAVVALAGGSWTIQIDMMAALEEPSEAAQSTGAPIPAAGDGEREPAPGAALRTDSSGVSLGTTAGPAGAMGATVAAAPRPGTAASAGGSGEGSRGETMAMSAAEAPTALPAEGVDASPVRAVAALGVAGLAGAPAKGSARKRGLIAIGAVACAAASALLWTVTRSSQAGLGAPPTSSGSVEASRASAGSRPGAEPRAGEVRSVQVVVLPSDASVEVEGKPAEVRDGILSLSGTQGSLFRVRVYQAGAETIAEVVISEWGARPAKIELVPGRVVRLTAAGSTSGAAGSAAPVAATGEPKATAAARPPKAPDPNQLDHDTHEFE